MNFENLLQDPLVVLEMLAVLVTFFSVLRLAFLDLDALEPPIQTSTESRGSNLISFARVGSLISMPKRSLAHQSI